jgi:histone H3/H4
MSERGFSLYDIEQFIREAGAEKVTEDAVMNLERELEKLTEKLTNKAMRYANHAGRKKLIKREDVALARKVSSHYSNYSNPAALRRKARITNAASIRHI